MFKKDRQVAALQYSGKIIKIGGYILVVYVVLVWYLLPFLNSGYADPELFFELEFLTVEGVTKVLRFFIPPIVMIWIGSHLQKMSIDRKDQLNDQLVGLLKSYSKISLKELGSKVGLTSTNTERALATIRANSGLDIAIADGYAMLEREMCKNCSFKQQSASL